MGYDKIRLANMALALFGGIPLQTFDASTPSGATACLLYDLTINGLFAEYPWNFARQTVALNQLNVTQLADGMLPSGWLNAFQLPANMIGLPLRILANNRYPDNPEKRFEIQGQTVFTDQVALWAVCILRVDELSWPDYFVTAAVKCLAAELYPTITGNGNRLADLQQEAWGTPQENRLGGALGNARRIDSRANPSRMLAANPLIDVRTATIGVVPSGATFP